MDAITFLPYFTRSFAPDGRGPPSLREHFSVPWPRPVVGRFPLEQERNEPWRGALKSETVVPGDPPPHMKRVVPIGLPPRCSSGSRGAYDPLALPTGSPRAAVDNAVDLLHLDCRKENQDARAVWCRCFQIIGRDNGVRVNVREGAAR
ncbi:hypothetical protein BV20DRAFT_969275 [Pilatotrama ljubarskyi]|nr:hypothetical protein BV20DRAFT_969275 [Pilatotrama ljubarskyi]